MCDISFEGTVSLLSVQPGDVVVLKTPMRLTLEAAKRMTGIAERALGPAVKVMLLEGDMDIEVLRREECSECAGNPTAQS